MSRTIRRMAAAAGILLLTAPILASHPHFRKTVSAKLPGLEVSMEYTTLPWNPVHLSEIKDGFVFHCGYATVQLTGTARLAGKEIPAGKYVLRARAKDADNWTFVLAPPPPDRNAPVDMAGAIELPTRFLKNQSMHEHLTLDLFPGRGDTDNKALFVLSWGDRQIEGVLADFAALKM